MQPLISVIVPIYNVEKYLEKCVSSIIDQTYKNIEILLVDDGATDSSGSICDKFAEKDSRVKVIHKKNSGVSDTRNLGIKSAAGEYFCFVDGDDNITPNYIETMYKLSAETNVDIAMCSYIYKWEDGREKLTRNVEFPSDKIFSDSGAEALRKMLYGKIYPPSSNYKLFKKSVCRVNYPIGYAIGEDVLAAVDYFAAADRVAMINTPCYNYIQHDSSVMNTFNPKKIFDNILSADEIYNKCEKMSPELKRAASYYLVEKNLIVLMQFYGYSECADKIEIIKSNIKKHRNTVLTDKNAEKRTRIACLISYLGIDFLCKVRNAVTK